MSNTKTKSSKKIERPFRSTHVMANRTIHYDYPTKEDRAKAGSLEISLNHHFTTIVSRTGSQAIEAHDWKWALKQLHQGQRVRRTGWSEIAYLHYDNDGILLINGNEYRVTKLERNATNWVLA